MASTTTLSVPERLDRIEQHISGLETSIRTNIAEILRRLPAAVDATPVVAVPKTLAAPATVTTAPTPPTAPLSCGRPTLPSTAAMSLFALSAAPATMPKRSLNEDLDRFKRSINKNFRLLKARLENDSDQQLIEAQNVLTVDGITIADYCKRAEQFFRQLQKDESEQCRTADALMSLFAWEWDVSAALKDWRSQSKRIRELDEKTKSERSKARKREYDKERERKKRKVSSEENGEGGSTPVGRTSAKKQAREDDLENQDPSPKRVKVGSKDIGVMPTGLKSPNSKPTSKGNGLRAPRAGTRQGLRSGSRGTSS